MKEIDQYLVRVLRWVRRQPLLYRFTLGTRILLALGFIPTGAVKMMGMRFSNMDTDSEPGALFEFLYQSGYYWIFLGVAQVMAGLLVLWERTAALGSILFLGIISNIFLITISYEFSYTPAVTGAMLLASLWLVYWDWYRIRNLFLISPASPLEVAHLSLSGTMERAVYVTGFLSGLLFFSILRGLPAPNAVVYAVLALCMLSFILAVGLGIRNRKSGL